MECGTDSTYQKGQLLGSQYTKLQLDRAEYVIDKESTNKSKRNQKACGEMHHYSCISRFLHDKLIQKVAQQDLRLSNVYPRYILSINNSYHAEYKIQINF